MNNNDIFSKPKKAKNKNPYFKYFVFAFSAFILILAVFSAFLFMRSIDFDFKNLVDRTSSQESAESDTDTNILYSVSELTGKNQILFVMTDASSVPEYCFIVNTDFDSKKMTVMTVDAKRTLSDGKTYSEIYNDSYISGLKTRINSDYSVSVDKYIIVTPTQFKSIISTFGGVTVNVPNDINYKSSEFNLVLGKGKQKLSDEYTYKYLSYADMPEKGRIMCDIINSVLTPEYTDRADDLFRSFVNNCKTDISVIDYSDALPKIKVYSNAPDKFYPSYAG